MPDDTTSSSLEFYRTRQGVFFVRWRAVWAFVTSQDASPYHDPTMSAILRKADNATAVYLAEVFDAAYENAAQVAKEMSFNRAPDLGGPRVTVRGRTVVPTRTPAPREPLTERATLRKFKWYGQLAYAKGIDRSPTHDRMANKELKKLPNDIVIPLLRAWEDGWDEAYDYVAELALERQSVLDAPKVLSARTIRQPRNSNSIDKG